MKRVINEFLNILQPLLVGIAFIALLVALVSQGGTVETAMDGVFNDAVDEITSEIE